jgi:hypothetical protein
VRKKAVDHPSPQADAYQYQNNAGENRPQLLQSQYVALARAPNDHYRAHKACSDEGDIQIGRVGLLDMFAAFVICVKNGEDIHTRIKQQPFVIQAALGIGYIPQPGIEDSLVQMGIKVDQEFHDDQRDAFYVGAVAELAKAWDGRRPQCGRQRAAGWFHGKGSFMGSKKL